MSVKRRAAGRLLFSILAIYLVVSLTFGIVIMTPDSNLRGMLGTAAFTEQATPEEQEEMRKTYLETRGRDAPLHERYVDWLVRISTFKWGLSPSQGGQVTSILLSGLIRTMKYLIPGVLAATLGGIALGLRSARHRGQVSDRAGRIASYVLLSLPSFWLAAILIALFAPEESLRPGMVVPETLLWTSIIPAGVVAAGLVAGQVSLTRSRSLAHVEANYVRFLRAKGMPERAVAWRILRNVLAPVFSMTAAELFSALVLGVVVIETVFGITGVGRLTYLAAHNNDIPLIMGTTLVLVAVGVGGSLLTDLASAWLDPRSRAEE